MIWESMKVYKLNDNRYLSLWILLSQINADKLISFDKEIEYEIGDTDYMLQHGMEYDGQNT